MNSPLVFIIPLYDTLSKYKKACLKIVKLYFFTGSINTNPVIIRKILTKLKSAGLITVARGTGGIEVIKPLKEITFYDVYVAIEPLENNELFNFHKNPNKECPVGKNIHKLLDRKLETIQKVMEDEMKKYTLEGLKDEMQEILGKKD
ncbi:Rrf2 family transcriptional regulator [Leptotrichia wadei]|uniref:Rrf2 family transcriptional regulator n=1 Tax=Leptotrichia wadei TaxID=157687 RepID=UPI00155ACCF3|nr:Rrf2 family transcriptional regulator [Leptotrichia wadei]